MNADKKKAMKLNFPRFIRANPRHPRLKILVAARGRAVPSVSRRSLRD